MVMVLTVTIVGTHSIATGDFVLIKHDDSDDLATSSLTDWKAKVLEARALDAEHVYIRVSWLNRPEDMMAGDFGSDSWRPSVLIHETTTFPLEIP